MIEAIDDIASELIKWNVEPNHDVSHIWIEVLEQQVERTLSNSSRDPSKPEQLIDQDLLAA